MVERRKFSPEYKVKLVLEMLRGEKGLMQASREYGINMVDPFVRTIKKVVLREFLLS